MIDINSTAPFSPLVRAESPLEEIHSAQVLSRDERARRDDGDAAYVDPRRARYFGAWSGGEHRASQASPRLGAIAARVDRLAARRRRMVDAARAERDGLTADLEAARARLEDVVDDYNHGPRRERARNLAAVKRQVSELDRLGRRRVWAERAASEAARAMDEQLAAARACV